MKINKIRPAAITESLEATEKEIAEEVAAAEEKVEECRENIEKEIEAADNHKDVVFEKAPLMESLRHDDATVGDLIDKLRELADTYEDRYDREQKIEKVSNTYFLGHPYFFLGIAGYDGGYVNLDEPVSEEEYDDEEYESLKEDVSSDAKELALAEAKKLLGDNFAVIYGYQKFGKFCTIDELIECPDEGTLKEATEYIKREFKPTGAIEVIYANKSLTDSLEIKDRNELSKVIKECRENNVKFSISRSLKEGYRYTVTRELKEEANLDKLAAEEKDAIHSYKTEIDDCEDIETEHVLQHIKDEEEEHLDELKELGAKVESLEEEKIFKEHIEVAEEQPLTESAEEDRGNIIDKLVTTGEAKDKAEAEAIIDSKAEADKEKVDEVTPFEENLNEAKEPLTESAWTKVCAVLGIDPNSEIKKENLEEEAACPECGKEPCECEKVEEAKEICSKCGKEVCECNKPIIEAEEEAKVDLGDDVEYFDTFDDVEPLEVTSEETEKEYDAGDFDYEDMIDAISFVTEDEENPIEQNKAFNFDIYKTEDGKFVAFGNETPFGPAESAEELKDEIRKFMKDSEFNVTEEEETFNVINNEEPEELELDDFDLEIPEEPEEEIKELEPEEEINLDDLDVEEKEEIELEDESDLEL